ncbi:MAG: bifunctional phosphopantothenoylcysteine decarboxylase/phosphopantothenate--cysteine ligase CoaBC [Phycisphaerales bacterium]|nr:MAG: bifunctional phosphopantothenoylcysteine decarboxylase/phosphopantothenate--cysteine ligase CoaBC [Phycisphaerales bacterium]
MPDAPGQASVPGREVLVGVCGGIAAYKVCTVVSRLVQCGAGVTVVMTRAAREFVTPLTFKALSGRPVVDDLWTAPDAQDTQHIRLTERADLVLVAPATANIIAKMACGLADEVLSTVLLAAGSPVLIAPSMNERMWNHPAVRANMTTLRDRGVMVIEPESGWLACRTIGAGRLADPERIADAVLDALRARSSGAPRARKSGSQAVGE